MPLNRSHWADGVGDSGRRRRLAGDGRGWSAAEGRRLGGEGVWRAAAAEEWCRFGVERWACRCGGERVEAGGEVWLRELGWPRVGDAVR